MGDPPPLKAKILPLFQRYPKIGHAYRMQYSLTHRTIGVAHRIAGNLCKILPESRDLRECQPLGGRWFGQRPSPKQKEITRRLVCKKLQRIFFRACWSITCAHACRRRQSWHPPVGLEEGTLLPRPCPKRKRAHHNWQLAS